MKRTWLRSMMVGILMAMSIDASARAQEAESAPWIEARQRFEVANQHFEQRDFASALTEWERVYALLEGHPNRAYVLYNIARSNEELGRNRQALEYFERFLAESAGRDDVPNRPDAERHARELRLRLSLAEESAPARPSGGGFSPIGIIVAAVGGATAIAGGVIGGVALAQDGSARSECEGTSCTAAAYAAIGEAGTLANVADAMLWGGLAVAAAGVVLTFVLADTDNGASASAACDGDGCAAVVRGRF